MTFSIRSLLALIVVAAFGFFTWRFVQRAQDEKNRLATILNEVESAETELAMTEAQNAWLANPVLQQAIQDEYDAVRSLRQQSEAHLQWLRDEYASIEPRGPGVLSIRSLPAMNEEFGETIAYRVHVPSDREIWLKCGVKAMGSGTDSGAEPPASNQVLQKRLNDIDRYEQRLSPGEHVVSISWGSNDGDQIRIRVTLDSSCLVDSNLPYTSHTWSRPNMKPKQYDYQEFPLPFLISIGMESPGDEKRNPSQLFYYDVSLSDKASNWPPFPGGQ